MDGNVTSHPNIQPRNQLRRRSLRLLLQPVLAFARARGVIRQRYLSTYVAIQQSTGNTNKINVLLAGLTLSEARFVLRIMNADIADSAYIDTHLLIHNPPQSYSNLRVRSGAYIGKDCFIDLSNAVEIGANATLAPRVSIFTHFDAGNSWARLQYPSYTQPVQILEGAYIGTGAIILPGVTIGTGALVAAGAVVQHDIGSYKVVGGVPAREISELEAIQPF
jgi:acetyltransferase-like isoleucine patch superfamily enzyme